MISAKNGWIIWALLSGLAFIGTAGSFLNFWAAVDLGYESLPGGKSVVAGWSYALIALFACAIGFATLAMRSWRSSRKGVAGPPGKG